MNKALFDAVKSKTKDCGLSEKYVQKITEKMGESIADDSTDDKAIEDMANRIAEIAVETQGEATRWATKNKASKSEKTEKTEKTEDAGKTEKTEDTGKQDATLEKLVALEKQIAALVAGNAKQEREKSILLAQKQHGIPDWRMKGLVVPDDVEPNDFLAEIKQDLITQNLMPATPEGEKATTEKAVDKAADSLLESITVK
ncbi:MAG: hypothetical protein LBE04_01845 [Prevotellaceae bacterium]|jgi:hypothetical protein|nr:hypothetical protein [Prevotellaceae bacterium]